MHTRLLTNSAKRLRLTTYNKRCSSTTTLSFGDGSQGALGTGRRDSEYEPEDVCLPEQALKLFAGHYHSFALTEGGLLWSWGRNKEAQLGRHLSDDNTDSVSVTPGQVKGLAEVVAVAASGVASFAATQQGALYAWGSSRRGQLGLGSGVCVAERPTLVPGVEGVTQLAAGWGHTLACTERGEVFSWGFPQHGRLGHSFAASPIQDSEAEVLQRCVWQPTKIEGLAGKHIKQVACTLDSSLALDEDGTLYTFGDNSLHQLGRSGALTSGNAEDWIVQDPDGKPFRFGKVAAGLGHCLAVARSGEVFAFGWNSAGQLGLGDSQRSQESIAVPSPIFGIPAHPGAIIAAGRVHSLLITDDMLTDEDALLNKRDCDLQGVQSASKGCVLTQTYSFGSGQHGRLGLGSQQDAAFPELIAELDGMEVLDAACGFDHSLLLVQLEHASIVHLPTEVKAVDAKCIANS